MSSKRDPKMNKNGGVLNKTMLSGTKMEKKYVPGTLTLTKSIHFVKHTFKSLALIKPFALTN